MVTCLLKTSEHDASKAYSDTSNIVSAIILILARFRTHKHISWCIPLLFTYFHKKRRFSFCFGAVLLPFLVRLLARCRDTKNLSCKESCLFSLSMISNKSTLILGSLFYSQRNKMGLTYICYVYIREKEKAFQHPYLSVQVARRRNGGNQDCGFPVRDGCQKTRAWKGGGKWLLHWSWDLVSVNTDGPLLRVAACV